jgi:hypothetical protein
MTSAKDELPLTNRKIEIPQEPSPITPLARALDLAENAKKHRVYRHDYSVPKGRRGGRSKPATSSDTTS